MELTEVHKTKLYNLPEVADFMGVSYITLYRMVKDGKIRSVNIAKTGTKPIYGVPADAVQDYYDTIEKSIGEGCPEGHTEVSEQAT